MMRLMLVLIMSLLAAPALAGPGGPVVTGDPQAIAEVQAARQKFASARSWRSRMSLAGQPPLQVTEFVAPDRQHVRFVPGGPPGGMVRIGSDTWIYGPGSCMKTPGRTPSTGPDARESVQGPPDGTMEITKGNPETVEGTPTRTYNLAISSSSLQARQKIYVAIDSGYTRRLEMTAPQGTVLIDYFDYDTPITIDPPC